MQVIVNTSFSGPGGRASASEEPQELPQHTAEMAIRAGWAVEVKPPKKRRVKKKTD